MLKRIAGRWPVTLSSLLTLVVLGFAALAIDPLPSKIPSGPITPEVANILAEPRIVKVEDGDVIKTITLVNRDQLRVGAGVKRVAINRTMRASLTEAIHVPETWDFTKGNTISFPMLGNDKWGDCFYVAAVKFFIAANANATGEVLTFDEAKLVARYRTLSKGDNGLSDGQIFPEMKSGVIGPNGPHKILDYAVVSSSDQVALGLAHYAFGPTLYTFSVPKSVMNNIKPGVLWDTQRGNYIGGHAVLLTGKNARGNYSLQTWGLNPPVEVTPQFIANNDPEMISVFSLEWFDKRGYAPNGLHYETLAPLWTTLTGGVLPTSPFPPPVGPTPPVPAPPAPAGTLNFSMTDLTPEAQARLKTSGVTSLNVTIGYGAPPAPPLPPSPMPPTPTPVPAPVPVPNRICVDQWGRPTQCPTQSSGWYPGKWLGR